MSVTARGYISELRYGGSYGVTVFKYTRVMGGRLTGFDVVHDEARRETIVRTYPGNGQYAAASHTFTVYGMRIDAVRRRVRG